MTKETNTQQQITETLLQETFPVLAEMHMPLVMEAGVPSPYISVSEAIRRNMAERIDAPGDSFYIVTPVSTDLSDKGLVNTSLRSAQWSEARAKVLVPQIKFSHPDGCGQDTIVEGVMESASCEYCGESAILTDGVKLNPKQKEFSYVQVNSSAPVKPAQVMGKEASVLYGDFNSRFREQLNSKEVVTDAADLIKTIASTLKLDPKMIESLEAVQTLAILAGTKFIENPIVQGLLEQTKKVTKVMRDELFGKDTPVAVFGPFPESQENALFMKLAFQAQNTTSETNASVKTEKQQKTLLVNKPEGYTLHTDRVGSRAFCLVKAPEGESFHMIVTLDATSTRYTSVYMTLEEIRQWYVSCGEDDLDIWLDALDSIESSELPGGDSAPNYVVKHPAWGDVSLFRFRKSEQLPLSTFQLMQVANPSIDEGDWIVVAHPDFNKITEISIGLSWPDEDEES